MVKQDRMSAPAVRHQQERAPSLRVSRASTVVLDLQLWSVDQLLSS
jgi:hypothetical protein